MSKRKTETLLVTGKKCGLGTTTDQTQYYLR